MKPTRFPLDCRRAAGAVLAFALALSCGLSCAAEPFHAFLDGLLRRQMFDMARAYLEQSKSNPLISEETRQRIPYEEGRLLIEEAASIGELAGRTRRLDEAQARLQEFIHAHPDHPVAAEATVQLGTVLIERGRIALNQAKSPRHAAHRANLAADAQRHFLEAQKVFSDAEQKFESQLAQFPKAIDPKDRKQVEARNQARLNLIQARMYAATALYDQTKTLDPKNPEYTDKLKAAAQKYAEIYEKYNRLLVGLYARMHQARCLLDLGNTTEALTYADEVLTQAALLPNLRPLVNKTLPIALEGWLHEKEKKFDKAIQAGSAWIDDASGLEEQTADGLTIIWLTAQAYKRQAQASQENKKQQAALKEAARLAAQVARAPGEHQEEARALVAELRNVAVEAEPATFADAQTEGKAAIDELATAQQAIKQLPAKQGDTNELAALERSKRDALDRAKRAFARAMSLRTPEVTTDQLNEVRYYQAYLNYVQGRYYDAAIVGEFVASRYPKSALARQAAKIALAAYLQAYNGQPSDRRDVELARMVGVAQLIALQWPREPDTAEAWMLLADVALQNGDLAKANDYLARIPPDSPARADADLKQGQALWARFLSAMTGDSAQRPKPAEMDQLLAQAQDALQRGIKAAQQRDAPPTYNQLAAELALAQLYNVTGQYTQALTVLQRPKTGPLAVVSENQPLANRANYGAEVLKCALRACVGAGKLDQAEQIMEQLDRRYADQPDGAAALTSLYVGLGRELEGQFKQLQASGKDREIQQVIEAFQAFLDRIANREAVGASTLNWIGETYERLAAGVDNANDRAGEAKKYFAKSADAYRKLLKLAENDPKLAPTVHAVRLRLARSLRGQGEYQQAIEQLSAILASNPNVLECQIEAARTYQMWGGQDPQYYQQAINGAELPGGARLWGWNGLRQRLQRAEKYRQQYEEARYNVADCSFRLALSKQETQRQDGLNSVQRLIVSFARLDPTLGGPHWRAKYDALLRDVQRAAGRQPEGLSTLPPPSTASKSTVPAG
jgi:tetratricopeptide (TPR) repeat protein